MNEGCSNLRSVLSVRIVFSYVTLTLVEALEPMPDVFDADTCKVLSEYVFETFNTYFWLLGS